MDKSNSNKINEIESENVSEINKLRDEVLALNEKVKTLESILLKISAVSEKTDAHIDFITNTYETFKAPLYYVKNKVDQLAAITFNKNSALIDSSNFDTIKTD